MKNNRAGKTTDLQEKDLRDQIVSFNTLINKSKAHTCGSENGINKICEIVIIFVS
jgi:hypothetical protein